MAANSQLIAPMEFGACAERITRVPIDVPASSTVTFNLSAEYEGDEFECVRSVIISASLDAPDILLNCVVTNFNIRSTKRLTISTLIALPPVYEFRLTNNAVVPVSLNIFFCNYLQPII